MQAGTAGHGQPERTIKVIRLRRPGLRVPYAPRPCVPTAEAPVDARARPGHTGRPLVPSPPLHTGRRPRCRGFRGWSRSRWDSPCRYPSTQHGSPTGKRRLSPAHATSPSSLLRLPARRDEGRPFLFRQPSPARKSCVPGAPVAARPATAYGRRTQRLEAVAQSGLPRARNLLDELRGRALSEPEGSQGVSGRCSPRAVSVAAGTARRPRGTAAARPPIFVPGSAIGRSLARHANLAGPQPISSFRSG